MFYGPRSKAGVNAISADAAYLFLVQNSSITERPPAEKLPALLREQRSQLGFGVLLNRMLFNAFAPSERSFAIERFYRLPAASVRRFYALSLTRADRLRLVCGRPPRGFSLQRALGLGAPRGVSLS